VKRRLVLLLKIGLIVLLVAYMVPSLRTLDLEKLGALRAGWKWMVLAQLFIFTAFSLGFYRWKLLLSAQGIHYSGRESFVLGFIGFFFNQFIPGSTGGDLVKAYYVSVDHPERRAAGITTVFLDRVVGVLVLILIAGCSIGLNWRTIAGNQALLFLGAMVGAILAGCAVAGTLFYSQRFRSRPWVRTLFGKLPFRDLLSSVQAAVYVYKFHPRLVLSAVGLSLVVQLSIVGMAICYGLALGPVADLSSFFFTVPLGQLAMSIPIGLPGGLGQSEAAYNFLFQEIGYPEGFGFLLALIQRANWSLWALLGGLFYFKRRGRVGRARQLAEAARHAGEGGGGGPLPEEKSTFQPAER
jgi:uncharacterized protein (TIRG00374 family)